MNHESLIEYGYVCAKYGCIIKHNKSSTLMYDSKHNHSLLDFNFPNKITLYMSRLYINYEVILNVDQILLIKYLNT